MAGLFLFADGGANAAVKYGGAAAVFQLYFSPAAKSYIAPSARLCPRQSRGLCFAPLWAQSLGVPARRAHFEGAVPQRHTERESWLPRRPPLALQLFAFALADGSGLPFSLYPPPAALESQLCKGSTERLRSVLGSPVQGSQSGKSVHGTGVPLPPSEEGGGFLPL